MVKQDIFNILETLLELPKNSLIGTESTKEWDSIVIIGLIAWVDENLNQRITVKQIESADTVNDIMAMIVI
jgi:hypothetical protein